MRQVINWNFPPLCDDLAKFVTQTYSKCTRREVCNEKCGETTMLIRLPKEPRKGAWQIEGLRKCVSVSAMDESASFAYCLQCCHCLQCLE